MRTQKVIVLAVAAVCTVLLLPPPGASAQTRDVTVKYMRAAGSAIPLGTRVSMTAEFPVDDGLVEATGRFLEGKGYSRFSVKEEEGAAVFNSMYCHHESSAFKALLGVGEPHVVRLTGEMSRGEANETAILVTAINVLRAVSGPASVPAVLTMAPEPDDVSYRLTLFDRATTNRTVLVDVQPGRTYKIEGLEVTLEKEVVPKDAAQNAVRIDR